MKNITINKIKGDPDSTSDIFLNGERVGSICKGWAGLGGNGWILTAKGLGNQNRYDTKKEAVSQAHNYFKEQVAN